MEIWVNFPLFSVVDINGMDLTNLSTLVPPLPYCRSMVDSSQPKLSTSAMFTTRTSLSCWMFSPTKTTSFTSSSAQRSVQTSSTTSANVITWPKTKDVSFSLTFSTPQFSARDMACFIKISSPRISSLIWSKWRPSWLILVLLLTSKMYPSGALQVSGVQPTRTPFSVTKWEYSCTRDFDEDF